MLSQRSRKLDVYENAVIMKNYILSGNKLDLSNLRFLLEEIDFPVDFPLSKEGSTALMLASSQCSLSMVNLLLSFGANPNKADAKGNTSVIYCLRSFHPRTMDTLRLLSQNGAILIFTNNQGKKPQDFIKQYKRRKLEEYEDLMDTFCYFTGRLKLKIGAVLAYKKLRMSII